MHWLDKIIALIGDAPKKVKDDSKLEIKEMIEKAKEENIISEDAANMMEEVLDIEDKRIGEVMVPRTEVATVNYDDSLLQVIDKAVASGHSRFPVIKSAEEKDTIMGILMIKDLVSLIATPQQTKKFHIKQYMRKAMLVPERRKITKLLYDFQQMQTHIAVVIDQYSLISGIITIENITEQIIGEISNEHKKKKNDPIKPKRDGSYLIAGEISLDDFNEFFNCDIEVNGADTLAGFALLKIGHIPKRGESFDHLGMTFNIAKSTNRKIELIRVKPASTIQKIFY